MPRSAAAVAPTATTTATTATTAGDGGQRIWSKDGNEARQYHEQDQRVVAVVGMYTPTHSFRRDLLAYCKMVNVTPHPKLIPMHPDEEENQGAENASSSSSNANIYDLRETESISIKNWQLDHGNCMGLCFALPLCPKIHSVCLFNVMLDAQQIEVICEAIPKTQVQILQLEWNASVQPDKGNQAAAPNIADADVADTSTETPRGEEDHSAVYAQLLGANSPVVFLSLRSNAITSDGATEIANALCSNTKLQSLNLFQNRIGDDGALAIAHALPQNGTLKTISVANNGITGKGAKALISAITRFEAPPSLLKEIEEAESKIQAEIDHAKKAKKKINRHTAMVNLGLPIFEVIDGVHYAPGNATLEDLILSGNDAINEADAVEISEVLTSFQSKLLAHLRHIKLQRIPSLRPIHQRGQKLSDFIVF